MSALNIVLTGATGGIGRALAKSLAEAGHHLSLVARDPVALDALRDSLTGEHDCYAVDLTDQPALTKFCNERSAVGGLDVLINNAGLSCFGEFETSNVDFSRIMAINLVAPMQLCQQFMPLLLQSSQPMMINIGSSFGSIAYPGFSVYCASKFGLRGFTEALQREYADRDIAIHYLAPRAVRTAMNSDAVNAMNVELGNHMDAPEVVADAVMALLHQRRSRRRYLGWPERFFVYLNAILPNIVGRALKKQLPVIRRYASAAADS